MQCTIRVHNGTLPQEELNAYLLRAREKFGREPVTMEITIDSEFVDIDYGFSAQPLNIRASPGTWWARWIALTTASAPGTRSRQTFRVRPV